MHKVYTRCHVAAIMIRIDQCDPVPCTIKEIEECMSGKEENPPLSWFIDSFCYNFYSCVVCIRHSNHGSNIHRLYSVVGVIPKEGAPACQSFFWYDNDKDLNVCFLVTHVTFVDKGGIDFWAV